MLVEVDVAIVVVALDSGPPGVRVLRALSGVVEEVGVLLFG